MKAIGLLTQDFAAYHDLVECLKERDIPFLSLAFGEPVPPAVGGVLTTPEEAGRVAFAEVVLYRGSADETVDRALDVLAGRPQYATVAVGIDPGERPGIAVYGDGKLLWAEQVHVPERVVAEVARAMGALAAEHVVVRVGHGAGTLRDRIINELLRTDTTSQAVVEEVDETSTSLAAPRGAAEPGGTDVTAAKAIALAQGRPVRAVREIRPTEGEIRDIQRKSRIASQGQVTIGRELAREVARGKLSLEDAIAAQQGARGRGAPGRTSRPDDPA